MKEANHQELLIHNEVTSCAVTSRARIWLHDPRMIDLDVARASNSLITHFRLDRVVEAAANSSNVRALRHCVSHR